MQWDEEEKLYRALGAVLENNTPKAVRASCQVRRGCATTEVQYNCMIATSLSDPEMVRLGSIWVENTP